jgi:tetratricopeptide (TPR) repeat protein
MNVAAALAALAVAASSGSLDEARAAFAAADYARAERLALAAAVPPDSRAALYLAGLSRFRLGRPAEALAAIDQAGDGADAPAAWHFNRGACLYALGRLPEAESEFLAAAPDPSFATLALVQAGFAALDAGAPDRARTLAARARASATGRLAELVDELDAALAGPPPGPAAAPPRRWEAAAEVDLGWDDDALQAGLGAPERGAGVARIGSALALVNGWGALRLPVGPATAELAYAFNQLAYQAAAARDRSVQQHDLALALRGAPRAGLHLEAAAVGGTALAGLSQLRSLQSWVGLQGSASLEHGSLAATHLDAGATWKRGWNEFDYLGGRRLEAGVWEELRGEAWRLRAGYRARLERIGDVTTALADVHDAELCQHGCPAALVQPLAYQGHLLWVAARGSPLAWLRLDGGLGWEWRRDLDDQRTVVSPDAGSPYLVDRARRLERRWSSSATATVRLTPGLSLSLHHEWLGGRPQLTGGGPQPPAWNKQVVLLGGSLTF